MRTARITDIHGNHDGLMAVLRDIAHQRCDRVLCLGDLVDGGPESEEVIRTHCGEAIVTVRGNHDEYAALDHGYPDDAHEYLQALPEQIVEGGTIYTHTSPRRKKVKIRDAMEAWNVFAETSWRRIFVGDVHVAMILGARCEQRVSATQCPIAYDVEFAMDVTDRYIVCIGAVGYSRDG